MDIIQQKPIIETPEVKINTNFKMVTFTLAGKDYGIDIMRVKEIRRSTDFTPVPNTQHFVRGVENLRGNILSVIDLRKLFNLPITIEEGALENMIILRLEDNTYLLSVIVDTIDKVINISTTDIKPPHPFFGDINIKYLSGIVEKDKKLYIILDVSKIFSSKDKVDDDDEEEEEEVKTIAPNPKEQQSFQKPIEEPKAEPKAILNKETIPENSAKKESPKPALDLNYLESVISWGNDDDGSVINENDNILQMALNEYHADQKSLKGIELFKEHLEKHIGFYTSFVNTNFIEDCFNDPESGIKTMTSKEDQSEFNKMFLSYYNDELWHDDLAETIYDILNNLEIRDSLQVWNVGCGAGRESYSIAGLLKKKFTDIPFKVWANDIDLMDIIEAPTLSFNNNEIDNFYSDLVIETASGLQFNKTIKDAIVFECLDFLKEDKLSDLDLIVARDVLSFIPVNKQQEAIDMFFNKLKPGGLLIVGQKESLFGLFSWSLIDEELQVYRKN